jgi:penicillin amidase
MNRREFLRNAATAGTAAYIGGRSLPMLGQAVDGALAERLRQHASRALPQTEGRLTLGGLREPVEVIRDRWGVAHIFARNFHDVYFTQGYVTASDRLFQIDMAFRGALGRLSALFGESTLPADRWQRLIGMNVAGDRMRQLDDLSREIANAWVWGIHAYIDRMPVRPIEYEILDVDPSFPPPAQAETEFALIGLGGLIPMNFDMELLRAAAVEKVGWEAMLTLFPPNPPETSIVAAGKLRGEGHQSALELLGRLPVPPRGQSNNWVVAGKRTTSGRPLIATDSHVGFGTPSVYYEIHLNAPGLDVSGVTPPSYPGIYLGRTAKIAWAGTGVPADAQDLYLERLNPERTAALYQGVWEPLQLREELIEVRGRSTPEVFEVLETRHGPLIDPAQLRDASGMGGPLDALAAVTAPDYALRWTFREAVFRASTWHNMALATNFQEFRQALRSWQGIEMNILYADAAGNIGYQLAGVWPQRKAGDGLMPVPGWTGEYEWTGMIPFDELPYAYNPEQGFLATANNRTYDSSYPHHIGADFLPPFRVRRISQLLAATEKHSYETFAAMHLDTVSLQAREVLPLMLQAAPSGARQEHAFALLKTWDYDVRADSAAAAIYEVWLKHLAKAMLEPRLGAELATLAYDRCGAMQFPAMLTYPSKLWFGRDGTPARDAVLRASLDSALDELGKTLGTDPTAWRWGALHTVRLVHVAALSLEEKDPDAIEFLTAGRGELGGDPHTVNNAGYLPSLGYAVGSSAGVRYIIDPGEPDAAIGVTVHGVSGNPASRHWNDQVPLRLEGRYHPMPFSRRAVEAAAESKLELIPGA